MCLITSDCKEIVPIPTEAYRNRFPLPQQPAAAYARKFFLPHPIRLDLLHRSSYSPAVGSNNIFYPISSVLHPPQIFSVDPPQAARSRNSRIVLRSFIESSHVRSSQLAAASSLRPPQRHGPCQDCHAASSSTSSRCSIYFPVHPHQSSLDGWVPS